LYELGAPYYYIFVGPIHPAKCFLPQGKCVKLLRHLFCSLGVLLCFAMISPSAAADSKVKVYMLSGILHISAGLSVLAGKLAQRGIAATVYESEDPDIVAEVIMRDYQNKKVSQIVLIGYSAGAGSAVLIAGRLNQARM
jgi:hypothetical protein